MPEAPVAVGPIELFAPDTVTEGWAVSTRRGGGDLIMRDASPLSKVLIRSARDHALAEPDVAAGRADWSGDGLLASPAVGEWFAFAAPRDRAGLASRWQGAVPREDGIVVDVTHARAAIWLRGVAIPRLLGQLCALGISALPPASALRTSVAGVTTDIVLGPAGHPPACLLHCDRSYGAFLAACLLEEGASLGLERGGFELPWRGPDDRGHDR